MAVKSKTALNTDIDTEITTNGNNEITGADLNTILGNMVDSNEDFVGSYTTVQIAALVGMTLRQRVFNTTDNDYEWYDGTRWVKEAHPKYKVYKALLSQTGTNAPVATVLENTLGGTVVWSYDSVGNYKATLSGAFTEGKTMVSWTLQYGEDETNNIIINAVDGLPDYIIVITEISASGANVVLNNTRFKIEVYY